VGGWPLGAGSRQPAAGSRQLAPGWMPETQPEDGA